VPTVIGGFPLSIAFGFALLVASLALLGATINRHIRGRLLLSAGMFATFVVVAIALHYAALADDTRRLLHDINPLLMAFAVINLVVALAINPWRIDRLPERFPAIVQDTLLILLFGLAATLILRDRILATTAVGAVVLGFALQDTLGNLFAGLAIQMDRPFRVGDWVTIGSLEGSITGITWRSTKLTTKAGNFVIVPNSMMAKDPITNYSVPTRHMRIQVDVGASYDVPPNVVKGVISEALKNASELSNIRPAEVRIADFGASSIVYRVWFWVDDFDPDGRAQDQVRSYIYYAFRRHNITIPNPVQIEMSRDEGGMAATPAPADPGLLERVPMFAALSDRERAHLFSVARPVTFAKGEAVVRQGQPGHSMFVMRRGDASVTLAGTQGEVARLGAGDVLGEMSLLTGEARSATVTALTDCDLLEIDDEGFRSVVMANPSVLEHVASVTSSRRQELDRHRETHTAAPSLSEARHTLLNRIRQFLRL
jgi:small-conductance mechanosensitive channel/CRP-like cAMP-binding protein